MYTKSCLEVSATAAVLLYLCTGGGRPQLHGSAPHVSTVWMLQFTLVRPWSIIPSLDPEQVNAQSIQQTLVDHFLLASLPVMSVSPASLVSLQNPFFLFPPSRHFLQLWANVVSVIIRRQFLEMYFTLFIDYWGADVNFGNTMYPQS